MYISIVTQQFLSLVSWTRHFTHMGKSLPYNRPDSFPACLKSLIHKTSVSALSVCFDLCLFVAIGTSTRWYSSDRFHWWLSFSNPLPHFTKPVDKSEHNDRCHTSVKISTLKMSLLLHCCMYNVCDQLAK